jgi:hypothetical protein
MKTIKLKTESDKQKFINSHTGRKRTLDDKEILLSEKLYLDGYSSKEIALKFDMPHRTFMNAICRYEAEIGKKIKRPNRGSVKKLSDAQMKSFINKYPAISNREIAKEAGLSYITWMLNRRIYLKKHR